SPQVKVPVLSKITRLIWFSVSITWPRVTKKPWRRILVVAALNAAGIANASAQGQVTTSTDKVTQSARAGSYQSQKANTQAQTTSKRAIKKRAILSATVTCTGFSSAAWLARRSMADNCVALPIAVTATVNEL